MKSKRINLFTLRLQNKFNTYYSNQLNVFSIEYNIHEPKILIRITHKVLLNKENII